MNEVSFNEPYIYFLNYTLSNEYQCSGCIHCHKYKQYYLSNMHPTVSWTEFYAHLSSPLWTGHCVQQNHIDMYMFCVAKYFVLVFQGHFTVLLACTSYMKMEL